MLALTTSVAKTIAKPSNTPRLRVLLGMGFSVDITRQTMETHLSRWFGSAAKWSQRDLQLFDGLLQLR